MNTSFNNNTTPDNGNHRPMCSRVSRRERVEYTERWIRLGRGHRLFPANETADTATSTPTTVREKPMINNDYIAPIASTSAIRRYHHPHSRTRRRLNYSASPRRRRRNERSVTLTFSRTEGQEI